MKRRGITKRREITIVLTVMAVIIAIGSVYVFGIKTGKIIPRAAGESVTMYLDPATATHNIGDSFDVAIKVNTNGASTDGVTATVLFDAQVLSVTTVKSEGSYPQELSNTIESGKIIFNAGSSTSTPVPIVGDVKVATITFKTLLASGGTAVTFLVDPNNIDNSAVSYLGTNILGLVGNASYIVTDSTIPTPTVDLKIDGQDVPISKNSGETVTLSWTSANATSCNASGNWTGAKTTSGSESTTAITQSSTYQLDCIGDGGSISDSVSVSINAVTPPPPTTSDTTPTTTSSISTKSTTSNTSKKSTTTPVATPKPSLLTPTKNDKIASVPTNIVAEKPQNQSTPVENSSSMKPWVLWLLYAILPAIIAGGAIYFYLKRKAMNRESAI